MEAEKSKSLENSRLSTDFLFLIFNNWTALPNFINSARGASKS